MPRPPTTILDLPEDLLAHVLRFATGSVRRDGRRGRPVSLSHWPLASVCTAFRRAFLKNIQALSLDTPAARRLAEFNWCALHHCTSLRRISITDDSELSDFYLIRLFDSLAARGTHLRQAHFVLDRHITPDALISFVNNFGPHITNLGLRIPCYRRLRHRRTHNSSLPPYHPPQQPNLQIPPLQPPQLAQLQIPSNPQQQPQQPAPPLPATNPQEPQQQQQQPLPSNPDADPWIHIFSTIPVHNNPEDPVPNAVIAPVVPVHQFLNDQQALDQPPAHVQNQMMMEVVDNLFAIDPPQPPEDVADFLDGIEALEQEPPPPPSLLPIPPSPLQLGLPPLPSVPAVNMAAYYEDPVRMSTCVALSDDVLATVLSRVPNLKELRIDRARQVLNAGMLALANCPHLEVFRMSACPTMKSPTLATVISSLSKLRILQLTDMPLVGNPAISAACTGPARLSLEVLHLTKIGRVTDPAIRQVVNACEKLESVHISDCPKITGEAASHLSCSLTLKDVYFRPNPYFPLTNRTSRHFSCASSTLRSLQLVGCRNLSLDGIVALGNLPGLRQLHLRMLRHVSQDVMRQLGMFPKLDDLLLEGAMYLTDLGVKVLCGQRGHRFLHLALLDSTNNLTDEALDCVMTWCGSLRSLQIHGIFKPGAIDRLNECIPEASLAVFSSVNGRQMKEGRGGVWDPPLEAV